MFVLAYGRLRWATTVSVQLKEGTQIVSLPLLHSLVPRPLPDFISQPWRKIDFSPRLRDKIWEWPGVLHGCEIKSGSGLGTRLAPPYLGGHCVYCTMYRHYMALHVEHIPLTTEAKALKVVELCEQYQLKEQGELMAGRQW